MKIAIVTDAIWPYTVGGSEIRNHEVAKRLVKMGHEVHILGAKFWTDNDKIKIIDEVQIHGISKFTGLYDQNSQRKITESISLAIKLFFYVLKSDFDIYDVTAFSLINVYTVWLACLIKRKKMVLTWHQFFGNYLFSFMGKFLGSIAFVVERVSLLLYKNHIVVSPDLKTKLLQLHIKEENIFVVKNGVDVSLIKNAIPSEQKSDIIFVGRLHYQKNVSELLNLILEIKKHKNNISCFIIGDGPEKEEVIKKISDLNLQDNVKMFGQISDKREVYSLMKSSKLFVLTSRMEGSPLTIVEAVVAGLQIFVLKTNAYSLGNLPITFFDENYKDNISMFVDAINSNSNTDHSGIDKLDVDKFDWQQTANVLESAYINILK